MLEIRQDNGTWETYTGEDHLGCGTDLAMSLVVQPVLSAAMLSGLRGGHLLENEADYFVVVSMDMDNEYHFRIDKDTWAIAGLEVRGLEWYEANYYYGVFEDMRYLRMIAIEGDTSLDKGGYRFYNIHLNGDPVPESISAVRFVSGRPPARTGEPGLPGTSRVFDIRGRAVHFGPAANAGGGTPSRGSGRIEAARGMYFRTNERGPERVNSIFRDHRSR